MRIPVLRGRKRMIAVDPGGVTGWLVFEPSAEIQDWGGYGITPIEWGEEPSSVAMCDRLMRLSTARLKSERIDGIVIESFYPRPGVRTWEPEPVEIAGFCRWLMDDDPARLFFQTPAEAKSFGTDPKINPYRRDREPPFNVGKGGAGHSVDALRHALRWSNVRWAPETKENAA